MIIGDRFAWGHLPKTGGDATLNFFRLFPELVTYADSEDTNQKHRLPYTRLEDIADKLVALNIRRLPSWILSYQWHIAQRGVYPSYDPMPMASAQDMAQSNAADEMLRAFTNHGTIKIDRWFRTEYLYHDLLDFVSEYVVVPEDRIRKVAQLRPVNTGRYVRDIAEWFTKEQIENMYANNPVWASIEQDVYDSDVSMRLGRKGQITLCVKNVSFNPRKDRDFSEARLLFDHIISNGAENRGAEEPDNLSQHQRTLALLDHSENFDGIEAPRGVFERVDCDNHQLLLEGWILLRESAMDSIRVFLNGKFVGSSELEHRQDIANAFYWIGHAEKSGFRFCKPLAHHITTGRIDLLGFKDGQAICHTSILLHDNLNVTVPAPPRELRAKTASTEDIRLYESGGLKAYSDLVDALCRYRDLNTINRILDWGCGCGRVTMHFLSQHHHLEVFGCDIDSASIEWCVEHLQSGSFLRNEPWPPTPYADNTFDLVISNSVLTHLTREAQNAWIDEMARLIVPNGLLLVSIYGASFASFLYPAIFQETPSDEVFHGIFAGGSPSNLDGLVPTGYYYPYVVQSRDYTIQEWSNHFEILEYNERGIEDCQDLVVMKRTR